MDLSTFTPGSALAVVVALAIAPFFAVMVTSFTKIVVTLSLLRNALGLQQVPPNIVINGLALVLTLYVMYPVGQRMQDAITANQVQQNQQGAVLGSTTTIWIIVPLVVFFSLQRYFVRGLLAGGVKG